ncbi:MAG: TetR/AcrR family transcriptional regulator [Roseovarius sp.]
MKNVDDLPLPERILISAFITFVEQGYDKASMDEVAAAAKTTKRTVYSHFASKEALFRKAISGAVQRFRSELPPLDPSGDPRQELVKFARQFSELTTWRRAILLQRVVIGESERFSDLGKMLYLEVIEDAERRIAEFLTVHLPPSDSTFEVCGEERTMALARMFLNMATGPQRFATLMEARAPAPEHPHLRPSGIDDAWVEFSTDHFLNGLFKSTGIR